MPRRHSQIKHIPYVHTNNERKKIRYGSRQAAQHAAEIRMLQVIGLELSVYQGVDGGWYLTSAKTTL